jgi:thioredoxin 1
MKFLPFLAAGVLALAASTAFALDVTPYSAPKLAEAKLAGKSVALHFHADWCPTCRAQQKVINELRVEKNLPLTIFIADYDHEPALREKLGVRTQSTLIVYKGKDEKARLAGETNAAKIRAALQAGL